MEIRTCTESDRDALRTLFRRAGAGAPTETLWGHEESEADVYLWPYLAHGTVLAAVAGGVLTGYLAGTDGTAPFPSEQERMARAIREHRLTFRKADALVEEWLAVLGDTGCHLQTLRENTRAVRFFERMGFRGHGEEPPVPGIRHDGGRLHQMTMVRP